MTITMEIQQIDLNFDTPPPIIQMEIAGVVYMGDSGTGGSGDMLKSVYDADGDGKVDQAASADMVLWDGIENKPVTYPPDAHNHAQYALTADIVDSLESNAIDKPLAANQGRVIKGMIDKINTLLYSDDSTLDEIQELVDYIKQNREILSTLSISNIAGLVDALAEKQDAGDYLLASAISAWAKADTKPTYDYSELTGIPLLYDISLTDVQAISFDELNMGEDGAYTLIIEGNLYAGNKNIRMFPNGLTSTPYLTYSYTGSHVLANAVGSVNNVAPYSFFIKGYISIKNGNPLWIGQNNRPYLDNSSGVFDPRQQVWSDTVNNITSISIDATGANFSYVKAKLYKGFR